MGLIHQPCPDCGSSDALQINDNGTSYCHSCKKTVKPNDKAPDNYIKGKIKPIPDRGLTLATCKKYGYSCTEVNGRPVQTATYKDLKGSIKWQKVRYTDKKDFFINKLSSKTDPYLFGMHLFSPSGNRKLTITEGEIDCMSASQMFDNKYAFVSLPQGAQSAEKAVKFNIEWINQFDEIYIMFDTDEAGQTAALKAAEVLPVGKTKIVTLSMKDVNEMLKSGCQKQFIEDFYNAREYRPDGIVYGEELWETVSKEIERGIPYPFPTLSKFTYGVRPSELIIIGAGSGIGKTTYLTALEGFFAYDCKIKIGIIHLEQQVRDTCHYLMSYYAQKPIFRPDIELTADEKRRLFEKAIVNDRIYFYNAFGCKDFAVIKNIIRYLVIKQNCALVFLDHLSAFGSGVKAGGDVNQTMRNISSDVASLTRELNFTLIAVSHLRKSNGKSWENGEKPTLDDFEGSSDQIKWADFVLAISRNKNAEGDLKHLSYIHCLKDRYTGKADGLIIPIRFDSERYRMFEDIQTEEYINNKERERNANDYKPNQEEQTEFCV